MGARSRAGSHAFRQSAFPASSTASAFGALPAALMALSRNRRLPSPLYLCLGQAGEERGFGIPMLAHVEIQGLGQLSPFVYAKDTPIASKPSIE